LDVLNTSKYFIRGVNFRNSWTSRESFIFFRIFCIFFPRSRFDETSPQCKMIKYTSRATIGSAVQSAIILSWWLIRAIVINRVVSKRIYEEKKTWEFQRSHSLACYASYQWVTYYLLSVHLFRIFLSNRLLYYITWSFQIVIALYNVYVGYILRNCLE